MNEGESKKYSYLSGFRIQNCQIMILGMLSDRECHEKDSISAVAEKVVFVSGVQYKASDH